MFTITDKKNPKKHGLIWDSKAKTALIRFINGKATTEDKSVADKLGKMGFKVEEKKSTEPTSTEPSQDGSKSQ